MRDEGFDRYEKGGFWRVDDITGARVRARDTRRQWDGAITHKDDWSPRHPQEFLRSVRDDQSVPNPRPVETIQNYSGPLVTELTAAAAAGATALVVDATTDFAPGDHITITLDSGDVNLNMVAVVIDATNLTISAALPGPSSTGARIVNYDAVSTPTL